MVLKRVMPCLLLRDKRLVKTINFKSPEYIGDPINAVKIFNDKEVDELILLDILASKVDKNIDFDLLTDFAAECFMPLAYGGGVKSIADFKKLYRLGIEKVIVNTIIFDSPEVIKEAVDKFGSQSVVASIDVVLIDGEYKVYSHSNREVGMNLRQALEFVEDLGVGEVMMSSVDNEGTWNGYDLDLLSFAGENIKVPLIINGGCGNVNDLVAVLENDDVQAAAVGSMAVYQKKGMGVLIRFPKREQIFGSDEY